MDEKARVSRDEQPVRQRHDLAVGLAVSELLIHHLALGEDKNLLVVRVGADRETHARSVGHI